jgi:hypothetical protein
LWLKPFSRFNLLRIISPVHLIFAFSALISYTFIPQ